MLYSNPSHEHQDHHDNQYQPETTAREVTPTAAVRPRRQYSDEQQDEDDDKYGAHIINSRLRRATGAVLWFVFLGAVRHGLASRRDILPRAGRRVTAGE